jgi:Uma2 family endonuclease
MAHGTEATPADWTAVDLIQRFGAIPLSRVRLDPPPGTASEQDVIDLNDHEDRLYELVDGTLVAKTVGNYESYLAVLLGTLLGNFVAEKNLGIVLGADGMMRLAPGLVRIPDVAFISWQRLPGRRIPRQAIWNLAPDLAVEVISKGNTAEEMARKLVDYFATGVRQVWYIDAAVHEARVYSAPQQFKTFTEQQTLDGGELLPDFRLELEQFFAEPGEAGHS